MGWDPDGPGRREDGVFGAEVPAPRAAVEIIPVPFEATASYRRGTRHGPAAVRRASLQVDLHDLELGDPWQAGIAWAPTEAPIAALGDRVEGDARAVLAAGGASSPELRAAAARVDAASEEVARIVGARASAAVERGAVPAVLGGDHASPYGLIREVAARGELGVLQVDAHMDLRSAYLGFRWSHASIFHNVLADLPAVVRLVQVGIRDVGRQEVERARGEGERVVLVPDHRLAHARLEGGLPGVLREAVAALPRRVHVSIDVDGLDPALCPHTGTPVPGGLAWGELEALLRELVASGRRITSFDLCEVSPGPAGAGEVDTWDAIVGARLLYRLVGWTLASRAAS